MSEFTHILKLYFCEKSEAVLMIRRDHVRRPDGSKYDADMLFDS